MAHREALVQRAGIGVKAFKKVSRQFGNIRPRVGLLRGMLAEERGDEAGAIKAWERSLRVAREMAMPFDEARALLELGRLAQRADRPSRLEEAAEIFERLGARHHLGLARSSIEGR